MFAAKLFTLHKNFSGIKFTVQELHSEATQENSTLAFAEAITNLGSYNIRNNLSSQLA
jgi:hypothetical protein